MAEQLEELCGNISLSEGERTGITITEGEIQEARVQGGRCLVGRLWMSRRVNKEAFKEVLTRAWRITRGVIFKELNDNIWLFEFEEVDDLRRVLEGRPWSFDRQMLVINEFDGKTPPAQMAFKHSLFWVQVHDMPLLCMTKGIAVKIGESLGRLEDVDFAGDGPGWGRCVRIRVELELAKPLERGRALRLDGKSYWVSFKYEKLPMFCFECGRIVHGEKGCPIPRRQRLSSTEDMKQWGVGLRADDGRRRGNGGRSAYSAHEGRPFSHTEDAGADGGDWRAGSMAMGPSGFSGTPGNGAQQLRGVASGTSLSGDSGHLRTANAGADRGPTRRGDALFGNTEYDGKQGENEGAVVGDVLEQISFNHGDNVVHYDENVGASRSTNVHAGDSHVDFSHTTNVHAGNLTALSEGSGAHSGDHDGAVETVEQGVGAWVPHTTGVACTPMETAHSTMFGAIVPGSIRNWKRTARQGSGPVAPVGMVYSDTKKRKVNLFGQAGGSTRGRKRNKRVEVAAAAETQELAVAETQPRHQL
jgi:hypothetical protein